MGQSSLSGDVVGREATLTLPAERGFTYIGILLAIAFLGIGLAAIGIVWATAAQRERETQLLFVGDAYRSAIASYYRAGQRYPPELHDLIEDLRSGVVRRHLRRIYADPVTGQPDWELIRNPDGGITGVVSTSIAVPLKRANFPREDTQFTDTQCYCDWRFQFVPLRRGRPILPAVPSVPTESPPPTN
jgi:type II secretory pathway pseudopilin PulG